MSKYNPVTVINLNGVRDRAFTVWCKSSIFMKMFPLVFFFLLCTILSLILLTKYMSRYCIFTSRSECVDECVIYVKKNLHWLKIIVILIILFDVLDLHCILIFYFLIHINFQHTYINSKQIMYVP